MGVFGYYIRGVTEWKTGKRHECTNMGKVKWLELWWHRTLCHFRSGTYEISDRM